MSTLESRQLERLRYRHGQTLRSQDFRNQLRIERQVHAWHNRALHNVYGVVKQLLDGLRIEQLGDNVLVHSGLAYDCFGLELLLCNERSIPFGEQREPMFLVVRRKDGCGCEQVSISSGTCFGVNQSRLATNNEFVWLPVKGFSFADGVPIARTIVTGNVVSIDPSFVAPAVRPLARPRIGSGVTIPGATTWQVWDLKLFGGQTFFSVQVKIDTSSAGFTTVPEYFATLQGPLSQVNETGSQVVCLHFDHLDLLRTDSFVFRFLIFVIKLTAGNIETQVKRYLQQQKAYVSWLGIERNPGDS
jgi:hypothetical protein